MNHSSSLKIQLEKQGVLEGDSTIKSLSRDKEIEVQRFFHDVWAPRDAGTGLVTGRRVHSPIEFRMEVGRASPLLFQAVCTNESVVKATFRFFTHGRDGKEVHFYTCEVEDGTVASISHVMPDAKDAATQHLNEYNMVKLTFRKITYTHVVAGKAYGDDWQAHNS